MNLLHKAADLLEAMSDKQRKAMFASMGMTVKKTKPKYLSPRKMAKQKAQFKKYLEDNPGFSLKDRLDAWQYILTDGKEGEIRTKFYRGPGGGMYLNKDFGN